MGAMESRHGGGQPFVRWLSAAAAGMVRRAGMGLALSLLTAGSLAALPAATASAQPGPEYAVGVVGTDGALWAQAPVLSPGWHRLGGHLIASPAIAAVPTTSGSTPLFIAVGTDHQLWVRFISSSWTPLGPSYCIGAPSAVVAQQVVLTVACEGGNLQLWTASTYVSAVLGNPYIPRFVSLGGSLELGPAVTFYNGQLVYFAETPSGQVFFQYQRPDFGLRATWNPTSNYCSPDLAAGERATTDRSPGSVAEA